MLSWMRLAGRGGAQDYAAARRWAEQAAGQGRVAAMARLGDIHHNALGVERDPQRALRWWREAALRGHAEAQTMFGAAHLTGESVARDPVEALHWLLRGEAGGAGELAAGFLREARSGADPAQRAEAERRAAEPLPPDGGLRAPPRQGHSRHHAERR
jgi:TPR repeat protein